jgi:two-component system, cell cycle sensor histidine kinase and response regulator CckA
MAPKTPETILVCDDEQAIRRFVRTLLARHGYQVLEAKDGKHAMAVAEAHDGPIHLLLSDVMMPELNGPGLAEQLRAVRPDIRVILMSAEWVSDGKCPFVQKPFLPGMLVSAIRDTLEP